MASLEFDELSGRYRIRFRYGGKPYKRSMKTSDRNEAAGDPRAGGRDHPALGARPAGNPARGRTGGLHPVGWQAEWQIVGRAATYPGRPAQPLHEILAEGCKAQTTLNTEETHISHLLRHLGKTKLAQSVTTADMQAYCEKRLRDTYRDKPIRPDTVKKEVATFRLIWNWAVAHGHLTGPAPTKGLKYPKTEQKPPFMTRKEIEKIIKRGGLTEEQEADCGTACS